MKNIPTITAALAALGLVSQAMAQNPAAPVIYFTGSTAFRSTIFNSLKDANNDGGNIFVPGTVSYGTWGNSSAGSANYMVFYGEEKTTSTFIYLNCAWSGSEAGIASACGATLVNTRRDNTTTTLNGSPETWVDVTNATLTTAGNVQSGNPGSGVLANGAEFEPSSRQFADLAQADTSQAVSWTPNKGSGATDLQDFGSEGVVTFTMSKNVNPNPTADWLETTNITLPQLNTLTAAGSIQAYFLTGDTQTLMYAYLVGRNLGSGTRMNYLSDSTYGGQNAVIQNSIGYGVDNRDPAQAPGTLILQNEGDNGYESGGGVAKALADTGGSTTAGSCQQTDPINGGTGWFAIGYLGPSDALSTGNNGGQGLYPNTNNWVTVDGVPSNNRMIENGPWWFWGHEHLYGRNGISGIQDTVGSNIFNSVSQEIVNLGFGTNLNANGHDAAIPYSLMNSVKSSDTAFPAPGQGE
jgi:hypothetical protein